MLVVPVAAAAIVAAGAAPSAARASSVVGDCTPGSDWGTPRQDLVGQVLTLVNADRAKLGLAPLKISPTLTASALWKSRHMAHYQYFAHADPAPPVARNPGDRLVACSYPAANAYWGENIAYGYASPGAVMQGWLNSPGHKANIESANFKAIGIGVAAAANGILYWTQDFGSTIDSASPASTKTPASQTTQTLKATKLSVPHRPQAGHAFRASVSVVTMPQRRPLDTGSVRCVATVSGQRLTVRAHSFHAANAACVWQLPPSAAGKTLYTAIIVRHRALETERYTAFAVAR